MQEVESNIPKKIKLRRMTDEERKALGWPTKQEEIESGMTPIELVLGHDPFWIAEEISDMECQ